MRLMRNCGGGLRAQAGCRDRHIRQSERQQEDQPGEEKEEQGILRSSASAIHSASAIQPRAAVEMPKCMVAVAGMHAVHDDTSTRSVKTTL